MQKIFTTQYIKDNCGCYNVNGNLTRLETVYKENNKQCFDQPICEVTIEDILNSNISLRDKYWFVCRKLATQEQNQKLAIDVAEIVLPIYEKRHPGDLRVRECIEAAKQYRIGNISLEKLIEKRRGAANAAYIAISNNYADYPAAYAAHAALHAANAAAHTTNAAAHTTYVAYAALGAVTHADHVAHAADTASIANIKSQLLEYLINFVNNN